MKESTRYLWGRSFRYLCEFFTAAKLIDTITKADAKNFREYMLQRPKRKIREGEDAAKTFSENTVRKTIAHARLFFQYAIDAEWVTRNPFKQRELKVTVGSKDKQYIPLETLQSALRLMPSTEWKAVLLLARICGMRVQSEGPLLEWSHIDWDLGVITVTDSKRSRVRRCPLFPELRPVLNELFEAAPDGARFVLGPLVEKSHNWRPPLEKWLRRGGIEPWPAMFNAMRSSAESDLVAEYGIDAACAWVGNSIPVAAKHYLQVSDDRFEAASKRVPKWDPNLSEQSRTETTELKKATSEKVALSKENTVNAASRRRKAKTADYPAGT